MGVCGQKWVRSNDYDAVMGAIEALTLTLAEETDHRAPVQVTVDLESDMFIVRIVCRRCGGSWGAGYLMPLMIGETRQSGTSWAQRWIRKELIPMGVRIMEEPCHSVVGRQQIQELVTTWLAGAGAEGLPYARVLGRLLLLEHDGGELGDVKMAIDRLGLDQRDVDGTQWLSLPDGHPDRSW